MKKPDNHQQILKLAEHLIQTVGYNAFSYHDIANSIGIKTSSIHYYFPTKADLGKAIVKKHGDELSSEVNELINNKKLSNVKKLEAMLHTIFAKTYHVDRKMCLGGMLASDVLTLPKPIQNEVREFFNKIGMWLAQLLTEGIANKEFFIKKTNLNHEVMFILSMLEGSLLLARLFKDEEYLTTASQHIVAHLIKR